MRNCHRPVFLEQLMLHSNEIYLVEVQLGSAMGAVRLKF